MNKIFLQDRPGEPEPPEPVIPEPVDPGTEPEDPYPVTDPVFPNPSPHPSPEPEPFPAPPEPLPVYPPDITY